MTQLNDQKEKINYLTEEDILLLNGLYTENVIINDSEPLTNAVDVPQKQCIGEDVYYSIEKKIYPLAKYIVQGRPFVNENVRTAQKAVMNFLENNQYEINDDDVISALKLIISRLDGDNPISENDFNQEIDTLFERFDKSAEKLEDTFKKILLPKLHELISSVEKLDKGDLTEKEIERLINDWAENAYSIWKDENKISDELLGVGLPSSKWVMNIVNPYLTPLRSRLDGLPKKIQTEVDKLKNNIIDPIEKKVWNFATYPVKQASSAIKNEITTFLKPLTKRIESVLGFFHLASVLQKENVLDVKKRFKWAVNAFAFLLNNDELGDFICTIETLIDTDYSKGLNHNEIETLLCHFEELFKEILINSSPMLGAINWIVECAINNEFQLPGDKGFALSPGRLYEFINDDELEEGEREFRKELVSALDRYIHGEFEIASANTSNSSTKDVETRTTHAADSKLTVQILSDILGITLQTSIQFIFRLPHMPSIMAPKNSLFQPEEKAHPQNRAAKHASATISRSISAPIKATTGMLFRGFWEVSTHNDSIVEVLSSTLAHFVGSFVESVSHTLFSLIEIREIYDIESSGDRILYSWPTRTTYDIDKTQYIHQAVILRKGVINGEAIEADVHKALKNIFDLCKPDKDKKATKEKAKNPKANSIILSLIQDYSTYIEISREHQEPDMSDKSIEVQGSNVNNASLITAVYEDPDPALPIVLRAFSRGKSYIMNKGIDARSDEGEGKYKYSLNLDFKLSESDIIHVFAGSTAHGVFFDKYI